MFNLPLEEVCSCARESAEELKSKIGEGAKFSALPEDYKRPVDFIEEWWRKSMIAANPETPDAVERFMRTLSFDLRGRVADGFSEEDPILYECHKGCCGSYGGSLAVYAAAADCCNLFLPDGFCPDGDEMIFAPHGVMITRSVFWENYEDEDDFMWHTVVKEVLLNNESCAAIVSSALWLRDYIVRHDDFDNNIGNLDLLYEAVAGRLRKADLNAGVVWRYDNLNEIIQESGSTIPAPDVSLYISTQRVGVTMTDGGKIVIFPHTT